MKNIILLLAVFLPATSLLAGSAADFDFWIGEWKVEWIDKEGKAGHGTNTVTRILDGKVIYEQFDGRPGIGLVGRSWSVYVEEEDIWKQTWVDNNGAYLDFTGGMEGDQLILSRRGISRGKPAIQRMRFHKIQKDHFIWAWEVSFDDGKTWMLAWLIRYTRLNAEADQGFRVDPTAENYFRGVNKGPTRSSQ